MITDSYPYFAIKNNTSFIFESIGNQGTIIKIIQFTLLDSGEWNLGFGDWKNGIIDDLTISNNHDLIRVIQTVAKATYVFFEEYPESVVIIKPVDERRKRLYNLVFQRHIQSIELVFKVVGIIDDEKETFLSKKMYDNFEITLKFES